MKSHVLIDAQLAALYRKPPDYSSAPEAVAREFIVTSA